ncbi:MAG: tetratricopeptide repeat protein [Candidatus Omnitrophota bacterium]
MGSPKWIVLLALMLAGCATGKGPEHFYFGSYSEAEKLYNKGQYEPAIEEYQAYIEENPEGNLAVIAKFYIGKSHAALGHNEEAVSIFKDIVRKNPDLVWADFAKNQLAEIEKAKS